MELLYPLLLSVSLALGHSLAWPDDHNEYPDQDQEELGSARWQLAYERWRRECQKYEQPELPQVSLRIARGQLAEPGMFPYQAALLLHGSEDNATQCGGSLISRDYVLTAAHCLNEAQSGVIYLGSLTYADANGSGTQIFEVDGRHFNPYPGYLGFAGYHDIALIRLPRPAILGAHVQPIALPLQFMQQSLLLGQLVTSAGWGALGDAPNSTVERSAEANLLHYVDVPVLEQQLCSCYFLPGLVIARQHICTDGQQGRGSCQGDSGGPLVYSWRNVSYLIGLTAFGSTSGCELGAPTVYTRITAYLDWIGSETGIGLHGGHPQILGTSLSAVNSERNAINAPIVGH